MGRLSQWKNRQEYKYAHMQLVCANDYCNLLYQQFGAYRALARVLLFCGLAASLQQLLITFSDRTGTVLRYTFVSYTRVCHAWLLAFDVIICIERVYLAQPL